jgi:hypothetical protein
VVTVQLLVAVEVLETTCVQHQVADHLVKVQTQEVQAQVVLILAAAQVDLLGLHLIQLCIQDQVDLALQL